MRKILLFALLLSVAVYMLTQNSVSIGHEAFVYQVPILYPVLALLWIFFGGMSIGMQWNIWEKYRLRGQVRYYQSCAAESTKRLDEARWLVCESARGRPLLRLKEVVEDYEAMMSPQADRLDDMRYHDADIAFPSNRVIEQSLKEERKIRMAANAEDSIEALHHLQGLPWDVWTHTDTIDYILGMWGQWSEPVRIFLVAKISPIYWKEESQQEFLKMVVSDTHPEKWIALLRKHRWAECENIDPNLLRKLKLLS